MTSFRITVLFALLLEFLLAIPILGGAIVLSTGYAILGIALIIHVIALIFAARTNSVKYASILGIITNLLAWIPFLGWFLHVLVFILYLIAFIKPDKE